MSVLCKECSQLTLHEIIPILEPSWELLGLEELTWLRRYSNFLTGLREGSTSGGGTGRHNTQPPHFRAVLVWRMALVNYFPQVPACRSKVIKATLLLDTDLDLSPANRHRMSSMCQNASTGFRNMTVSNAGLWSLLHLSFPALEQHWMKTKQFLPSWHVLPVHWGGQIHLNPSTRSWQVPPWPQGFGEQSSISVMQNKERLSSTARLAMAVWTSLTNGCCYSGFSWGTEEHQDFYLEFTGYLWFQQKPHLKRGNGGSKHWGKSLPLWPFCKWKSYLDPASPSKQHF